MERIPRTAVAILAATAILCTAAGLWLHAAGGQTAPGGLLQYAVISVGTAALGSFLLWRRPGNRYGQTHLAIGVLFGAVVLAAGVLSAGDTAVAVPGWTSGIALAASWLLAGALLPLWVIAIVTFPDGAFHHPLARRGTIAVAVVMPTLALLAYLLAPPGEPPPLVRVQPPAGIAGPLAAGSDAHPVFAVAAAGAAVLGALAPIAAVAALLHRFHTGGPVVRQQIKWLLVPAAVSVALQTVPVHAIESEPLAAAARALVLAAVPLPLIAVAVAVLKHRLWDIDVVIPRGLVFTLASGVLTVCFLGVALLAGVSLGGPDARVAAAVGLALLVALLAQPLRRRLERRLSRLLYGDQPSGLMALARLNGIADAAPGARQLGFGIADGLRTSLGSGWAGVWLYFAGDGAGTLRPLAVAGAGDGLSALLPRPAVPVLSGLSGAVPLSDLPPPVAESVRGVLPEEPRLVAPLVSGGALLGLLACGGAAHAVTREEAELLTVVARESALALRNLRLEEELRQRLEQIERQAAELHDSRQRLVAVQDEERRRIERDLHDGAQQRLVSLAARLRRAAETGGRRDTALTELADEAEEAVFALQELARGIYPSLLADRGLVPALSAQAARLPADIRVEAGYGVRGRRFDRAVETALYFVALEALTNAVKHAPGARIGVSLAEDAGGVTLEVRDDGPGMSAAGTRSGTGLQNMRDRIEALGGILTVGDLPGGGTRVRARVERIAGLDDGIPRTGRQERA
ncbi:GAF domain-containing sensor histidine kinase [Lysobacter korlensis]|uniref:histidine kinase n=1 Tax=Lysobacter korlensis TaxID=553636 RepID=A0ABV6RXP1_9GAMM